MLKSYKTLEKEFQKSVKTLQGNCKHKKTQWMEHWWAIGHSSGYKVKVCLFCNKELEESPTKEERELEKNKMLIDNYKEILRQPYYKKHPNCRWAKSCRNALKLYDSEGRKKEVQKNDKRK